MIESPSSNTDDVPFYVPIFRDGPVERNVVDEFSGLERFRQRARQPLPLIELVDDEEVDLEGDGDDIWFLEEYRVFNDEVLVDVPVYLTEHDTEYTEAVERLLDDYDNVAGFFNDVDGVDVPVLSHKDERPIDYGTYLSLYSQLSDEYEQCGLRLFVSNREFTPGQENALENLAEMVSDQVLLLVDLVDKSGLENETVTSKLEHLESLFDSNLTFVLNAFEPYDDQRINHGPQIARNVGLSGFGDYVINRRFERNIPVGGNDVDRYIRHYFPSSAELREFEGDSYEAARARLTGAADWDGDHCEFCRRAEAEGGHHRFWKRVRMGHYLESVLSGETA